MEYTDAPTLEPPVSADTMECPLCGHILPKDADACDRCDWVRTDTETAEGKASDGVAVMLSVIPGLGHVYKGYKLIGLLFFFGAIGALLAGALAATATAGFGLFLSRRLRTLPEELHVDRARHRPRVDAFWDGCAWIV